MKYRNYAKLPRLFNTSYNYCIDDLFNIISVSFEIGIIDFHGTVCKIINILPSYLVLMICMLYLPIMMSFMFFCGLSIIMCYLIFDLVRCIIINSLFICNKIENMNILMC
jgi:hypothetical protein